jgi:hypothetical protein
MDYHSVGKIPMAIPSGKRDAAEAKLSWTLGV